MIKISKYIFLLFLFIIIVISHTISHEVIHNNIQIYHGCTDTKIGFNGIYAFAKCYNYVERSQETINQEYLLHSLNEIFGYTGFTIILYLFSIKLFKIMRENEKY